MLRIGVIGAGGMGKKYINEIASGNIPNMTLTAICTRTESTLATLKQTLHIPFTPYTDYRQLITSGKVDAVLIVTPHLSHPEITAYALSHDVHVLCDKPVAVTTADARQVDTLAQAKPHLKYGVIFNQRTHVAYLKIKALIESGELGQLQRVNLCVTNWYRPDCYYQDVPWRGTYQTDGGGVLINQAPHNLDILCWLFGLPSKVMATCHEGKWHDIEVEDDVTAYMTYDSGLSINFVTSTGEYPGTNRLEMSCDRGKLVYEADKLTFYRLSQGLSAFNAVATDPFAKPEVTEVNISLDEATAQDNQYVKVLKNFASAVLEGTPLIAPGVEGINSLMLANAMYLSSWLERSIQLPLDEDLFVTTFEKMKNRA